VSVKKREVSQGEVREQKDNVSGVPTSEKKGCAASKEGEGMGPAGKGASGNSLGGRSRRTWGRVGWRT